jgi:carbonic anhydrase
MLTFTDDKAREIVKPTVAPEWAALVDSLAFLPFTDVDQSVRDDVAFLKKHPLVHPDTQFSGWTYQVRCCPSSSSFNSLCLSLLCRHIITHKG